MHHIVHDTDRDGWGSAALLLASLGPAQCRLVSTSDKDIRHILDRLRPEPGDTVWVLDIPAPPSWKVFRLPGYARFVWVDHHLAAWYSELPDGIEVHLPADDRPTTTMHLLLQEGLANPPRARDFVAGLCRDDGPDGWGAVFDGLSELYPDIPVSGEELRDYLASAVAGNDVPDALGFALERAASTRSTVQATLDRADTQCLERLVVIRLDDAHRIPLSRYSLAAARSNPVQEGSCNPLEPVDPSCDCPCSLSGLVESSYNYEPSQTHVRWIAGNLV